MMLKTDRNHRWATTDYAAEGMRGEVWLSIDVCPDKNNWMRIEKYSSVVSLKYLDNKSKVLWCAGGCGNQAMPVTTDQQRILEPWGRVWKTPHSIVLRAKTSWRSLYSCLRDTRLEEQLSNRLMRLEVDTNADLSNFDETFHYIETKSRKLLEFGTETVIWIFSKHQKTMVFKNPNVWTGFSWNETIEISEIPSKRYNPDFLPGPSSLPIINLVISAGFLILTTLGAAT